LYFLRGGWSRFYNRYLAPVHLLSHRQDRRNLHRRGDLLLSQFFPLRDALLQRLDVHAQQIESVMQLRLALF